MKRIESGLTLAEVLIAVVLLGAVMVTASSFLTTSFRFFKVQNASPDANLFIAIEYITRSVKKANSVAVGDPGQLGPQLTLRVEKDATDPPTASVTDDQWVVYRFIGGRLRTKSADASGAAPEVAASDPEVVKGFLLSASSSFTLTNPTASGSSIIVQVRLVTPGGGSGRAMDVTTSIIPGAMSK